jgi:hypothetical protein
MAKKKGTGTPKTSSAKVNWEETEVTEVLGEVWEGKDYRKVPQSQKMTKPRRLYEILKGLKEQDTIEDDQGKAVEFQGQLKQAFMNDVELSYPVVRGMVRHVFETGEFLHGVRERQKEHGLWIRFLDTIGLSRRTAHNYIQAYERFGDQIPNFSYLGVTKLLITSRVKDPVAYVQEHEKDIAASTTSELTRKIAELRKRPSTRKRKPMRPEPVEMGYQRVRAVASGNGKVLTVHGLDKNLQSEVIKALKKFFVRKK